MTDNFRQFALAVENFAEQDVPEAVQQATQKIGLQALRGVVLKTPVDTGRARANWQTTLGSPAEGQLETTDKNGATTITQGAAVIQSVQPFGTIWLANNVDYIERLEDGSSQQSPNGMVSVTLTELQSQFRRVE